MKPNIDNIWFIARTYTKLAIIRRILSRGIPHGNAGKRVRDRIWAPYRESSAEKAIRDSGGAIRENDEGDGVGK